MEMVLVIPQRKALAFCVVFIALFATGIFSKRRRLIVITTDFQVKTHLF